jgi:hypothetical protein
MPPRLMKPTDVPESRRPLVDSLWRFYVAANRPPTRRIAQAIEALSEDQRNGTANHETIRRTLRGESVGSWQTVEVIFLALCELSDVDPHDIEYDDDDRWNPPAISHIEGIRQAWHQAVDGAPPPAIPRTRAQRDEQELAERMRLEGEHQRQTDFAKQYQGGGNFDDEPPF